jgi:hypothetical protein
LVEALLYFALSFRSLVSENFRRVLGEEKFQAMLFGSGSAGKSDLPNER